MSVKQVDYKGLKCPMPIFKLGKEIKELGQEKQSMGTVVDG